MSSRCRLEHTPSKGQHWQGGRGSKADELSDRGTTVECCGQGGRGGGWPEWRRRRDISWALKVLVWIERGEKEPSLPGCR